MTRNPNWNGAVLTFATLLLPISCTAWIFPLQAVAVGGTWLLPTLSVVGLALALGLAVDIHCLRGFLPVLVATLILGWLKAPASANATVHFAGVSVGLLLMLIVGRFVDTPRRMRLALLAFLVGGLVVLILGSAGTDLEKFLEHFITGDVARKLPAARLGFWGLEPSGDVNPNALAAVALLVVPVGASVMLQRTTETVDWIVLRPLGLVVSVAGSLVLAFARSRTAWMAVWLTLVMLLVRGPKSATQRLVIGLVVVTFPLLALNSVRLTTRDDFVAKAGSLWSAEHDRAHVMLSGVEKWRESPWFGIGLNQFRNVYKPPPPTPAYDVAHAHNFFVQTALDVGVFGLVAYCCILGLLLKRADRVANAESPLSTGAAVGAGLSLVSVTMFGLADAVALGAKIGVFQWMAGGLILGAWRTQLAAKNQTL